MVPRTAALLAAAALAVAACSPPDHPGRLHEVTVGRWVDPFIGTGGHGHTYPGATAPFGMVQVGPDNGRSGWDWSSGYHWSDSVLTGFSHTHLSGTGIGDLLDVLVMPVAGGVDLGAERGPDGMRPYADRLDHDAEMAAPGYYAARLQRSGIGVELTATPRVGLHRIRYPKGAEPGLVVDLGFAENWDEPIHVELIQIADTLFLGRRYSKGWAVDQRVHFALATSRPVLAITWAGEDPRTRAHLAFGALDGEPLLLKVALSYVDESGALSNLEAEAPGWDFDGARARAGFAWESELSKVMVSGGTADDRTIFYTALYRTRLAPVLFQDLDGRYRAADGRIREAQGFTNHSIFSLWDTFRAAHPLNTLLDPERVHDLVASMVAFRRESGLLPVWSLVANETNTMTGNHAVPVVVDAVLKGLTRVPAREVLAAVIASQSSDLRDLNDYRAFGWVPSELGVESVTKTLEYAYDDAAVARLAEHVGAASTARRFRQRAQAWREVYDPGTGFMRGRHADGSWVEPFDPLLSDHRQNTDYTEGNAWQHSWFVPHDPGALVQALGGEGAFLRRLDELFEQDTVVRGGTHRRTSPGSSANTPTATSPATTSPTSTRGPGTPSALASGYARSWTPSTAPRPTGWRGTRTAGRCRHGTSSAPWASTPPIRRRGCTCWACPASTPRCCGCRAGPSWSAPSARAPRTATCVPCASTGVPGPSPTSATPTWPAAASSSSRWAPSPIPPGAATSGPVPPRTRTWGSWCRHGRKPRRRRGDEATGPPRRDGPPPRGAPGRVWEEA